EHCILIRKCKDLFPTIHPQSFSPHHLIMDSSTANCRGLSTFHISFFYFIIITSTLLCSSSATRDLTKKSEFNTSDFIKTSCGTTLYPKLCIKTLSPYSNSIQTSPMELANSALTVSLKGAKSTTNKIAKMSKEQCFSSYQKSFLFLVY
ncbi:hypothetical protein AABB24_026108, partial [Solanum stoloniferum]